MERGVEVERFATVGLVNVAPREPGAEESF